MTSAAVATMAVVLLASGHDNTGKPNGDDPSKAGNPSPGNPSPGNPNTVSPPSLAGPFPFGVWLQDPLHSVRGQTAALYYRKMGITHWIGMYDWPSEANRYPGYNVHAATELQRLGFEVYAGGDQAAINWNLQNPQFASTFLGYVAGDEPEMTKMFVPEHYPPTFRAACQVLRQGDPSRLIWSNYGKGFAKIPWSGYQPFSGPTIQDDHNKYTDLIDVASVSFYGMTDPYEVPNYVGIWTYGKAIQNTRYYVDANPANPGLPIWGFIETGSTFYSHTGLYEKMPPDLIKSTVWCSIVHGATGITYFAHDISPQSINPTYPIDHPAVGQAVMETNHSVTAYGAVLATSDVPGTTVTTTGNVGVATLTKHFGNDTYIFAMGEGNAAYEQGQSVTATISLLTKATTVDVLDESRQLTVIDSSFTDRFAPYQLHIYRIPGQ